MSDPFIGEIKIVGFNFAPRGWANCDGSQMSIAQNSALFSLLGTTYGGNGTTTFALPDLRGRSPVGIGQGPGLSPITQGELSGTENVTILSTQMPMHTHTAQTTVAIPAVETSTNVSGTPSNTSVLGPVTAGGRPGALYSTDAASTTLAPFNPQVTVSPAGGSQPLPIRNPYLGLSIVIALEGIFPSRP
jgi:microcystin-dependent protein